MWFKNGLKAQKLLAQGIALGMMAICKTPCKGKSFVSVITQGVWSLHAKLELLIELSPHAKGQLYRITRDKILNYANHIMRFA